MTAYISVTVRDYSRELSTVRFPVAEMLAAGTWADMAVRGAALAAQVAAMSMGEIVNWSFSQDGGQPNQAVPADDAAQRETAVRVFYHGDTSGKKATLTIPAADLGAIELQPNSDLVDLTTEPTVSFVTAFEANVALAIPSELGGYWNDEAVVDYILFVGRNH